MRWKWPYITRSGGSRNRNQPTDFAEEAILGTTNRILGPNFGYLTTFAGMNNANYNGLLTSLTKRATEVRYLGNLFFTVAYTWSHNLDNGSGFNSRNTQIASYNHHVLYGNS